MNRLDRGSSIDVLWAFLIVAVVAACLTVFFLPDARGSDHTGISQFCGNSRVALMLSEVANSENGKQDPYLQMLYSARIGACYRKAAGELSSTQAMQITAWLDQIIAHVKHNPTNVTELQRITSSIKESHE